MSAQAMRNGEISGFTSRAILLLPAMGVPTAYYGQLVQELTRRGFIVTVTDLNSSAPRTHRTDALGGYAEAIEQRIPEAYETAQRTAPGQPVIIVGHSLGGQLGLVAAGRYFPEAPVVLIASGTAHHRAFSGPRRWTYLAGSQAIASISRVIGFWPGDRLGFGGRQPVETMRDWARNVRTGKYMSVASTFEYGEALNSFRGEVLAFHVKHDHLAPIKATLQLLAQTNYAGLTPVAYTADRGKARPGSHFTWARDLPGLVPQIEAWALRLSASAHQSSTTKERQ